MQKTPANWQDTLSEEKQQPYFQDLIRKVNQERVAGKVIYPPNAEVFQAFVTTPLADIRW